MGSMVPTALVGDMVDRQKPHPLMYYHVKFCCSRSMVWACIREGQKCDNGLLFWILGVPWSCQSWKFGENSFTTYFSTQTNKWTDSNKTLIIFVVKGKKTISLPDTYLDDYMLLHCTKYKSVSMKNYDFTLWRAVFPSVSHNEVSAPYFNNNWITLQCPQYAARCKAVTWPVLVTVLAWAPQFSSSSHISACPFLAA